MTYEIYEDNLNPGHYILYSVDSQGNKTFLKKSISIKELVTVKERIKKLGLETKVDDKGKKV